MLPILPLILTLIVHEMLPHPSPSLRKRNPSLKMSMSTIECESVGMDSVLTVLLQRMHLMMEPELTTERKNGLLSES